MQIKGGLKSLFNEITDFFIVKFALKYLLVLSVCLKSYCYKLCTYNSNVWFQKISTPTPWKVNGNC